MSQNVYLVDDDDLFRGTTAFNLEQAGYRVTAAPSAEDALMLSAQDPPDIVLLDIGLPGMDGLEALRAFKDRVRAPVILVTARRRELDEVLGLELGADDYVTKPVNLDVLLAHIRAVLRRGRTGAAEAPLIVGDLSIDAARLEVSVGGRVVELSPLEFKLLRVLALHAGQVLSVDELLDRVWGVEYAGQPQVVYVYVCSLRRKVEADPDHPQRIVTVRGWGYRLERVEVPSCKP